MGRPREHDERTAAALLAAADRIVGEHGPDALSVRGVASEVGTSTRAVYSLFGSKDGLVAALVAHAFDLLREDLEALPPTDDPAADLIEAGMAFRRFASTHLSLFLMGVHRELPASAPREPVRDASIAALTELKERIARLAEVGRLGGRTVDEATRQFDALCEGLATVERRDGPRLADAERMWRDGLSALVFGFATPR